MCGVSLLMKSIWVYFVQDQYYYFLSPFPWIAKNKPVNPKGNQSWIFVGGIDAEAEAPILWPPDVKSQLIGENSCWERLKAGGEEGGRGWDGWMASPTQWTWVWENSGSWWWTGKPGMLACMPWGRKELDMTEQLNWTGSNNLLC